MDPPTTILSARSSRPPLWVPGTSRPALTDDLLREASQRLQVMGLVSMGLWALYFLLGTWIVPYLRGMPAHYHLAMHLVCLAGFLLSLAVYFLARSALLPPQRLLDAGLVYMVGTAALIARMNLEWFTMHGKTELEGVSWICVLVLLYPMIVPNTSRRILAATFTAAALDPLFFYIGVLRERGELLPASYVLAWHNNFICAALAVVPARMLDHLSRKVQRARELGSYELLEPIGTGGMGEVWRARHHMLARPAAIKIIRPAMLGTDATASRSTLRRFEREAQATAALQSPHTIEIFDFGIDRDGSFYYVMEFLHGFDLEKLVQRFGPLPSARVTYLLLQACHSLDDAHASGLVHRDIKPANIFTCRKGQDFDFVKVLDFGLVKTVRAAADMTSLGTLQGSAPGTPGYMAPEQILGDGTMDHRVDIYALGCVGYWLLTGRHVFAAETLMKLLLCHVQDPPVPPSQCAELPVDGDLEAALLACLEKQPDRRPASVLALRQQLGGCRGGWDEEQARAWWTAHAPELVTHAAPAAPVVSAPR